MVRQFVQPGSQNVPRMALTGKEIVQIVRGSAQETQTTTQAIADLGGGGGLPPGGYLDQPLTNAGTSGTGHWSNTIYARSGTPGTVADGTALLLYGEQGFTTGAVGYGAGVTLGGGRHEGDDGSYGGDGILKGGGAGTYGGGYVNALGANSDAGPGGIRMGGGYAPGAATPNVISISAMPQFDPGANESTIQLQSGSNTYRAGDIDLIANSAADIINGNIKVTLNANTGAAQGNLYLFGLPTAVTDLPDDALWIEPGTGVVIAAPGTGTGGGGGAAIEPESGPGIKISAMTPAAFPMGADDFLAGVQVNGDDDLLNAKFSQAQILTAREGTSGHNDGYSITISGGLAYGNGAGGGLILYGGYGSSGGTGGGGAISINSGLGSPSGGDGGPLDISGGFSYLGTGGHSVIQGGGSTSGPGGYFKLIGGVSQNGNGGYTSVYSGAGTGGAYKSGNLLLGVPAGLGGAASGDVIIAPNGGNLLLESAKTADPSTYAALWINNGVVMQSGVTNYSGTTTIAGIGVKTLTIVNGIITSIA